MKLQKWNWIANLLITAVITATLTGCQSVPDGGPHPFSTMFQEGVQDPECHYAERDASPNDLDTKSAHPPSVVR